MFFRRFVAFLLLFAISQIPLAVAFTIREWETISVIVSAGSEREGEPRAAPKAKHRRIAPGKRAGDLKKLRYGGLVYRFRWCPPGEFTMGSPESERGRRNDEAAHRVRLTRGFWILESEVTQAMWKSVMEPGNYAGDRKTAKNIFKSYRVYPMGYVGLSEARSFCEFLSKEMGCLFLLPTEAQWEYACRAGTIGPFAGTGNLADLGWSIEQTDKKDEANPAGAHRVKTKKPNAWGIFDMHGNLSEWVGGRYGPYDGRPQTDPLGPREGENGVTRGGSVRDNSSECRSASRAARPPLFHDDSLGFRILLIPDPEPGESPVLSEPVEENASEPPKGETPEPKPADSPDTAAPEENALPDGGEADDLFLDPELEASETYGIERAER